MKVRLIVILVAASLVGGAGEAQDICPDVAEAGEASATLFLKTDDGTCVVANNGYAKKSSTAYEVHTRIQVSGSCQIRVLECTGAPPACQCVNGPFYLRNIMTTTLSDSHNDSVIGYVLPEGTVQLLDTAIPLGTTNTGANWLFGTYEEIHTITSVTNWYSTPCGLTPTSFPQDEAIVVNVVKCQPLFDTLNGHIRRLDPSRVIDVYLPTNMSAAWTALSNATNEWNEALAETGMVFNPVAISCGTGPDCITVTTSSSLTSCGFAYSIADPDTGLLTGNMTLTIRADWDYSSQGLERTFVHELGHFVGLYNYNSSACSANDAAMQELFDCTAPTVMNDPQFSDYRPVVNSTYGGNTQTSCGF